MKTITKIKLLTLITLGNLTSINQSIAATDKVDERQELNPVIIIRPPQGKITV